MSLTPQNYFCSLLALHVHKKHMEKRGDKIPQWLAPFQKRINWWQRKLASQAGAPWSWVVRALTSQGCMQLISLAAYHTFHLANSLAEPAFSREHSPTIRRNNTDTRCQRDSCSSASLCKLPVHLWELPRSIWCSESFCLVGLPALTHREDRGPSKQGQNMWGVWWHLGWNSGASPFTKGWPSYLRLCPDK